MARYIDVDAWNEFYIDRTKDLCLCDHYHLGYGVAMDYVDDWLDARPTIEARPVVRGEWENHGMYMICPVCGAEFDDDIVNMCRDEEKSAVNFCGHCGADMRGEDDG